MKIYRDFGEKLISKDFLEGAGYNFSMLTHSLEDSNKKVCNFCFDYAIRKIESGRICKVKFKFPKRQERFGMEGNQRYLMKPEQEIFF